jgi:hypothetical protein
MRVAPESVEIFDIFVLIFITLRLVQPYICMILILVAVIGDLYSELLYA